MEIKREIQHTQGRLEWQPVGAQRVSRVLNAKGALELMIDGLTEANARRLVACWNVFDGMPTEQIECLRVPAKHALFGGHEAFIGFVEIGVAYGSKKVVDHLNDRLDEADKRRAARDMAIAEAVKSAVYSEFSKVLSRGDRVIHVDLTAIIAGVAP